MPRLRGFQGCVGRISDAKMGYLKQCFPIEKEPDCLHFLFNWLHVFGRILVIDKSRIHNLANAPNSYMQMTINANKHCGSIKTEINNLNHTRRGPHYTWARKRGIERSISSGHTAQPRRSSRGFCPTDNCCTCFEYWLCGISTFKLVDRPNHLSPGRRLCSSAWRPAFAPSVGWINSLNDCWQIQMCCSHAAKRPS